MFPEDPKSASHKSFLVQEPEIVSTWQNVPNTVVIATEIENIDSEHDIQTSSPTLSTVNKVLKNQKQKVDGVERICDFLDRHFVQTKKF